MIAPFLSGTNLSDPFSGPLREIPFTRCEQLGRQTIRFASYADMGADMRRHADPHLLGADP